MCISVCETDKPAVLICGAIGIVGALVGTGIIVPLGLHLEYHLYTQIVALST